MDNLNLPNDAQRRASDEILSQCPWLGRLREKLLGHGGSVVADWYDPMFNSEITVGALLAFGLFWPTKNKRLIQGEPNNCHENAAALQKKHPDKYRAITGFALAGDGIWRPNSWIFDMHNGCLVETTDESATGIDLTNGKVVKMSCPWTKYFGHPELAKEEIQKFSISGG